MVILKACLYMQLNTPSSFVRLWLHNIIYINFPIPFFFGLSFENCFSLPLQEETAEVVSIGKTYKFEFSSDIVHSAIIAIRGTIYQIFKKIL